MNRAVSLLALVHATALFAIGGGGKGHVRCVMRLGPDLP